ncbi:hypothetical protein N7451_000600 [Penicillium sp. IBT 35674x]|nr:hypothetical protein N7451_000600 [Penicillium sp. IBT 35674x]
MDELTTEKCAILLRFPYFSIQKMETASQSRRSAKDNVRTLLQYYYNFESTKKRDQEQVTRKVGLFPEDHVVHVPQIWAVIVNFRFIITSAPIPLTDQGSSSLKIMDSPAHSSSTPSVICVIDPLQRVFFFPIELCKTFLLYKAMRHNIMEHCLRTKNKESQYGPRYESRYQPRYADRSERRRERRYESRYQSRYESRYDHYPPEKLKEPYEPQRDFELLTAGMKVIQAEDWPGVINSRASAIIQIHVQMISPNPTKRQMKKDFSEGYDDTSHLYTEPREKRRFKAQKYPLPSSGIVVNRETTVQKPNDITSVAPDFYIPMPQVKPTSPSKEPNSHQKDGNQETQDSGDEHRSIKRGVTFDSVRGESLKAIDKSSVESKPTVNTGFPPVFTWPVTKRSFEPRDSLGHQAKSSNLESPDPDSAKNVQSLHEETEAQHTHEETIKHVSTHIDGELRESIREDNKMVYKETTEMSFFQVDKAIIERMGISISFLMMTDVGKAKRVSDPPPWKQDLKEIVSSLCRLFNFFVPLAYPCVIGDKFWGAIHDLITVMSQICDTSQMLKVTKGTRSSRMTTAFYVVNIRDEQYADLRDKTDLDLLIKDITHCDDCYRSRDYSKQSDAWDHLFKHHFRVSSAERVAISSRSQWVMDREQYLTFICRRDGQKMLDELKDGISSLENLASQIQHGVSENGELDRNTYRIPSSLVDAFQSFLMMVLTGAHAVKSAYQLRRKHADSDPHPPSTFLARYVSYSVANFANEVEIALETAIRDIILMTFTNEKSDIVSYEAMSPSLVIALIMGDVRCRDSHGNSVNLVETYEQYIQVLQFKAGQRPNRRLMQEIYTVREELLMVEKITKEQHQILTDYRDVLRPDTFRITTESRISSFEIESRWLQKLIDGANDDLDLIETLLDRLESIATQTRNGVEVRQEDQGKAILVFTIMTVVFMPLSFVTGYFGMNTEDIRNMGSSQTLFWTVSIPFTVVIISAVLLVAFQADRFREAFDTLLSHDDVPVVRPVDNFPAEKQLPEGEEKGLESKHNVESSGKRWFARRRVVNWKAASQDSSFA